MLRRFKCRVQPWSYDEYIESMDCPSKRQFYLDTKLDMEAGRTISNRITPFTKLEKMGTNKYKAPRLIQARHPTFNLALGCYIKPLERALKFRDNFGKGTYDQIGAKVARLSRKYKYYTEGDHLTFDAHVTVEMLRLCHRFYLRCFNNDSKLLRLCGKTIRNRALSRNGERYTVNGTRMSGDVDTSFGNSIINYYIIRSVLADLHLSGDAIVNGDDYIIFTDVPIDGSAATTAFRRYNMDTKLLPSSSNIHTVSFCRTKLFYHPDGHPTMGFDPVRLKKIYGCTNIMYPFEDYMQYLELIHHANYMININSPIHTNWKPLPKLESKLKKYMTRSLERVFNKQLSNKPYDYDYLTPSYIEAYPDYVYDRKVNILYTKPKPPIEFIINHNIKEISQC
ncbi:hypothetical protein 2 [Hubei diptera virus 15]|uniref:hypothetical protein 2 n=1 Tax=Hubei diptera virus 15 TaxID=1922876 RepID=UPI00090BAE13|nr:hypothetical protein 2 [Hubei diptera virus 15]APG76359.1 hypothetical protein 2 [Hubei diptera virus 15]